MKTKLFTILAMLIMLTHTSVMAQQTNKDVNGDGKVNVADVVSVIKSMKDAGSIGPKYYWYIGQENPAEMTEITATVTDYITPGWRLIGTSIPEYNVDNMLWNGVNFSMTFESRDYIYIAIPYTPLQMFDSVGGDGMVFTEMADSPVMLNGAKYYVYKSDSKLRGLVFDIY